MPVLFLLALSALLEIEFEPQFQLALHSSESQNRPSFITSDINVLELNIPKTDNELISQRQSSELPFLFWEESEIQIEEGDEGITTTTFTVKLSEPSNQDVTVDYEFSSRNRNLDDCCNVENGSLTIEAGQISGQITIESLGNLRAEPYSNFEVYIDLKNPLGATLSDDLTSNRAALMIREDDTRLATLMRDTFCYQTKRLSDLPGFQDSCYGSMSMLLSRWGDTSEVLEIEVSTVPYGENPAAPSDLIGGFTSQRFVFDSDSPFDGQPYSVRILGDTDNEGEETFVIQFRVISGSSEVPDDIVITIIDGLPK